MKVLIVLLSIVIGTFIYGAYKMGYLGIYKDSEIKEEIDYRTCRKTYKVIFSIFYKGDCIYVNHGYNIISKNSADSLVNVHEKEMKVIEINVKNCEE